MVRDADAALGSPGFVGSLLLHHPSTQKSIRTEQIKNLFDNSINIKDSGSVRRLVLVCSKYNNFMQLLLQLRVDLPKHMLTVGQLEI
jgi:hypothetical protein